MHIKHEITYTTLFCLLCIYKKVMCLSSRHYFSMAKLFQFLDGLIVKFSSVHKRLAPSNQLEIYQIKLLWHEFSSLPPQPRQWKWYVFFIGPND